MRMPTVVRISRHFSIFLTALILCLSPSMLSFFRSSNVEVVRELAFVVEFVVGPLLAPKVLLHVLHIPILSEKATRIKTSES